jgi:hypothetical protein
MQLDAKAAVAFPPELTEPKKQANKKFMKISR